MSEEGGTRVRFGDFPDWYRPLFDVTDPEVAFDLASKHLRRKRLRGGPRRVHSASGGVVRDRGRGGGFRAGALEDQRGAQ
ncbi:hypothetical protein ACFQ1L_09270 [Phytohabitans flavus]|uniref:hypothetical protein n=1 Tax=Phytohabitans flavus TaxID=1076124 RepID=UPI00363EB44F